MSLINSAFVMQVSAPESSLMQSSFVLSRSAKKSVMPLAVSANQSARREKTFERKVPWCGVEDAEVSASVARVGARPLGKVVVARENASVVVPKRMSFCSCIACTSTAVSCVYFTPSRRPW